MITDRACLIGVLTVCTFGAGCRTPESSGALSAPESVAVDGQYRIPIRVVAVSSDDRFVLGADDSGLLQRFDLASMAAETLWTGHNAAATAVAFGVQGHVHTFGRDGAFRSLDPERPGARGDVHIATEAIAAAIFSPDGRVALSWDAVRPPGPAPTLCGHHPAVLSRRTSMGREPITLSSRATCAAFSADGSQIVFADDVGIQVSSAADTGTTRHSRIVETQDVHGLAVTNDGRRVAITVRGQLHIVDMDRDALLVTVGRLEATSRSLPVFFTPESERIVALPPDLATRGRYNLDVFDAETGERRVRVIPNMTAEASHIALSRDGGSVFVTALTGELRRYRLSDGAALGPLVGRHWLGGGFVFSGNGERMATCWRDRVQVRHTDTGVLIGEHEVEDLACTVEHPLALDPSGERAVVGATPSRPLEARAPDGTIVATYERPPGTAAHHPAYSRNGEWMAALVVQGETGRFVVWPAAGGEPRGDAVLPRFTGLRGIAVAADGAFVVASYGRVQNDGTVVGELSAFRPNGSTGPFWSRGGTEFETLGRVALLPDDRRLVFANSADIVHVVDAGSGETLARLSNSADTVWTFSRFGTVGVFAVLPSLEAPRPLRPRDYANALAVSPDGRFAAVSGFNRSNMKALLEVFEIDSGALIGISRLVAYPRGLVFAGNRLWVSGVPRAGGDLLAFGVVDRGG